MEIIETTVFTYNVLCIYVHIRRTRICSLKSYGIMICSAHDDVSRRRVDVMGYAIIMCIIIIRFWVDANAKSWA